MFDHIIIKWLFENENNTNYFCNLGKMNFAHNSMRFIDGKRGVKHDSDALIKEFYFILMRMYMLQEIQTHIWLKRTIFIGQNTTCECSG